MLWLSTSHHDFALSLLHHLDHKKEENNKEEEEDNKEEGEQCRVAWY